MNEKLNLILTCLGEIMVIIGAALWITSWQWTSYIFALGTVMFATGRFFEKHPETQTTTLKRLYRQQCIGIIMLMASAGLMLFYTASRTAWLVPFIVFTVAELYTAFRIPHELKKTDS
ncbi:MAG: hypothetical protein MJZ20_05940 [Bacteroidaceae bacterium]|nr:hypothetical protein [Bacteroidaceae bacterium]